MTEHLVLVYERGELVQCLRASGLVGGSDETYAMTLLRSYVDDPVQFLTRQGFYEIEFQPDLLVHGEDIIVLKKRYDDRWTVSWLQWQTADLQENISDQYLPFRFRG